MPQSGYYFTLVAPLEEYVAHSVGEDVVQPVPPMHMVTELEAIAPVFLHELVVLPSEPAEDLTKGGIADDDIEFRIAGQECSHPRKRTSSDSLWQQMQGRAIKPVILQSTSGTAEKSKNEERVVHMTCYSMLDGTSVGPDDLVLPCILGSLTRHGCVVIPHEKGKGQPSEQRQQY